MSAKGKLSFQKMPLLIALVAMAAGIVAADAGWISGTAAAIASGVSVTLYVATLALSKRRQQGRGIVMSLSLLAITATLAALNTHIATPHPTPSLAEAGTLSCRIDDVSLLDDYTRLRTTVVAADSLAGDAIGARLLVNINALDYDLLPGDVLTFRPEVTRIANQGNPAEFDYATYMARQGFFYRQTLKPDTYLVTGRAATLLTSAATARLRIADYVLSTRLSEPSQQFLIAVLLGDRTFIGEETKATFASAGLAHILALSGLHVGLIALFIYLFLFPLDFLTHGKPIRLVVTFLILIGYAYLTGFSPSVTRALVMYAFASMAFIAYRPNESLNALCGAALLLLAVNPLALYDTGAQMSFLAVAGILTVGRALMTVSPKRKLLYWLVSSLSVTIGAMAATGIVAAYYFSSFPALFVVSNIVVVPLMPLLLGWGIVAVLSDSPIITASFDFIYSVLMRAVQAIADATPALFSALDVGWIDVVAYFIVAALAFTFLTTRRIVSLTAAIACLALWIGIDTCRSYGHRATQPPTMLLADRRYCPLVSFDAGTARLCGNIDDDYTDAFARYNRRLMAIYGAERIATDTLPAARHCPLRYTIIGNRRVIFASRSFGRKHYTAPRAVKADYLVVTSGFNSDITRLASLVECDTMIVAANAAKEVSADAVAFCNAHNIPYIDMRAAGAFTFPSPGPRPHSAAPSIPPRAN